VTAPFISPPDSVSTPAEKTVEMSSAVKSTELKTEVLNIDTGSEQRFAQPVHIAQETGQPTYSEPAQKKGRSKLLWLIPVAGVLLFLFAGTAVGLFVLYNSFTVDPTNSNTEETNVSTPEPTPEGDPSPSTTDVTLTSDPTPEPTVTGESTSDPTPQSTVSTSATRKPTPAPTRQSTPRPQPTRVIKPSTPRPTPRKTPKKNMDCIFTDSC
jgi:hypothetical protein